MPRMRILSPAEQSAFDTPLRMNAAQRKAAFDLPLGFQKEAEQLRDPTHQIVFCLNAGSKLSHLIDLKVRAHEKPKAIFHAGVNIR